MAISSRRSIGQTEKANFSSIGSRARSTVRATSSTSSSAEGWNGEPA